MVPLDILLVKIENFAQGNLSSFEAKERGRLKKRSLWILKIC